MLKGCGGQGLHLGAPSCQRPILFNPHHLGGSGIFGGGSSALSLSLETCRVSVVGGLILRSHAEHRRRGPSGA